MGLISVGRNFLAVRQAAAALDRLLQKYKTGGHGIDLPENASDPTRVDDVAGAAVLLLLKKYGDRLVVSRFRGRVQLAWRSSAFANVEPDNRKLLEAAGFYAGAEAKTLDDLNGINPAGMADPRTPEGAAAVQRSRDERVKEWQANGWKGLLDSEGNYYTPPDPVKP